jgi:hypothetical protein
MAIVAIDYLVGVHCRGPTPPLGDVVLGSHFEVVWAVGVGLPMSLFPTPALSSLVLTWFGCRYSHRGFVLH